MCGHQHLQRYLFAERFVAGKHVLDLACGVGYGTYVLRMLGARAVVGADLDAEAVAYAVEHYQREGLRYEQGNALHWESREKYDVVVSFETIEHLSDPANFLKRVAQLLVPGGILVISAPNTLQYLKANPPVQNEHHINEPDYAQFRKWLEADFQIESEWEQSPITPDEPRFQQLQWAVANLFRQIWVKVPNKLERIIRRLTGRPLPAGMDPNTHSHIMNFATAIMPLLPERTAYCNVFVFVCRRRDG